MLRHERRVVFLVRGSRFETHADILSQLSPRFRELFAGSNSPYEIDERPLDFRRLLNLARGAEFGLPDPSFERFLDKYQVVLLDSLKPSEESSDRERNETCLDKVETNTFSFASPWRPIGLYFATIPQMSRETVYWPVTKPIDSARLTLSPRAKSISRYVFDMREPTSRNDHIWIVRDLRLRFRLAFKAERAPTTGTFSRANAVAHALARVALYYLTSLLDMITGEVLAVQLMLQDLANSQDFRDLDEFDVSIPFWRRASSSGATFLPIRNISEFLDVHQGLNSPFTIQNLSLLVDLELVKIPSQNAIMFYPCLQWHNCIASNFKTKFSISSSRFVCFHSLFLASNLISSIVQRFKQSTVRDRVWLEPRFPSPGSVRVESNHESTFEVTGSSAQKFNTHFIEVQRTRFARKNEQRRGFDNPLARLFFARPRPRINLQPYR